MAEDAAEDIAVVIGDLVEVLNEHGETIYKAVKNNDEIEELIKDIKDQLAEAKELAEWINDHPFEGAYNATLVEKEAALNAAYDQLVYLYNRLYAVTLSVIDDVDEDAALALEDALDALCESLCIAGEAAEGYLGWLAEHGEAMGAELLTALLENLDELLTPACPIIDEMIWALLAQIEKQIIAFLPIADQWMYDWLYNNPDKVIAFFTEYGDEIAWLVEQYGDEVLCVLGYIVYTYGPDVLEYIINNPEEALEQFVNWYNKYGYRVWPMIDVYLEELGVYDMINGVIDDVKQDLMDTLEKNEQYLKELGIELEGTLKEKIEQIKAMIKGEIEATVAEIEKAINELIAMIEERLYDTTHGEYTIAWDSYYVAIDELYGEGEGYADKLAAELGIAYTEINELDADEIAKADLITVRYNNEAMIAYMIDQTTKAMAGKAVDSYDWSVYVGETGAEYLQQAMTEVSALLNEQGLGEYTDIAMIAVESYAYEYVGHLVDYIVELETITDINPEALVISVGMNNALADAILTLGEEEVALGEYIQYVVDAANLEAFAYALITGDAIYVDAPAVDTAFDGANADIMNFISTLAWFFDDLKATDEGHEYIKEQILGALEVAYEVTLGDVDLDGDVDARDAALAYGIFNEKVEEVLALQLLNADVDGDNDVDARDAALIYAYFNVKITAFPAE